MRIAYILPSLKNQGPIVLVKNLVDYLVHLGCCIDIYYFDDVNIVKFSCNTYRITPNEPIDFDSYDVIHSHCLRPDKYVAKWKHRIVKAKIITTLHQDTYASFRYEYNVILACLFTFYWCWLQSKFDGITTISNQLKNSYSKLLKNKVETIYNGCSLRLDHTADETIVREIVEQKKRGRKIIGTYAYMTKRKGVSQVLRALLQLPDIDFIIIGEGPYIETLKEQALEFGIAERVHFFPYQANPNNYLQYFDVYVMPSYSEGFGLSMVEAALAHKAIVCSDIPSFREIFPENEGVFFELDNIEALVRAINFALDNMDNLGRLAYQRASEKFTSAVMAQNYLNYYRKISGRKNG